VHTVLSACAEAEMVPPRIVARALELGLAGIAITDHNSAENVVAVQEAALESGLTVVPGMEIQTVEEVDLLALFADLDSALATQREVYDCLEPVENRPEYFGEQIVVDAAGFPLRENRRFLQGRTALTAEQVVTLVHGCGGLVVAAHVDRPSRSLLANLGFVPPELKLDGIEISRAAATRGSAERDSKPASLGVASFGDAHQLSQMTNRTQFLLEAVALDEIRRCFRNTDGRALRIAGVSGEAG